MVPLNTFYKAPELGYVLHHADVDTLLTVDRFLNNDYLERLVTFAPGLVGQTAGSIVTRPSAARWATTCAA